MVEIFALNICESISRNNIECLIHLINKERADRVLSYRRTEDIYRSLLGELVIRYAVFLKSRCSNKVIKISNKGKPNLLYPKDIHFNISHSRDWVLGGIAEAPIGIDIEFNEWNRNYEKIAERFFTETEQKYVFSSKSIACKVSRFYKIWTLKESYLKADGRGLLLPMTSFSIIPYQKDITIKTDNPIKNCRFYSCRLEGNYSIAVCSINDEINKHIELLTIKRIQDTLLKNN